MFPPPYTPNGYGQVAAYYGRWPGGPTSPAPVVVPPLLSPAWFIDPQNVSGVASDKNTGTSIDAPLLTHAELQARRGGGAFPCYQDTTVTYLSFPAFGADPINCVSYAYTVTDSLLEIDYVFPNPVPTLTTSIGAVVPSSSGAPWQTTSSSFQNLSAPTLFFDEAQHVYFWMFEEGSDSAGAFEFTQPYRFEGADVHTNDTCDAFEDFFSSRAIFMGGIGAYGGLALTFTLCGVFARESLVSDSFSQIFFDRCVIEEVQSGVAGRVRMLNCYVPTTIAARGASTLLDVQAGYFVGLGDSLQFDENAILRFRGGPVTRATNGLSDTPQCTFINGARFVVDGEDSSARCAWMMLNGNPWLVADVQLITGAIVAGNAPNALFRIVQGGLVAATAGNAAVTFALSTGGVLAQFITAQQTFSGGYAFDGTTGTWTNFQIITQAALDGTLLAGGFNGAAVRPEVGSRMLVVFP